MAFRLGIDYKPRGDQTTAIDALVRGLKDGEQHQVLLGVTGSGKTFTMAKVIEHFGRPGAGPGAQQDARRAALSGIQDVFPVQRGRVFRQLLRLLSARSLHSRPATSTSKKKPPSTTSSTSCACPPRARLFERRDCVIVASVSCIYGLGSPEAYYGMLLMLEKGQKIEREEITARLVDILYERHEGDFKRGTFRVRGDVIEIFPTYDDSGVSHQPVGRRDRIAGADRSADRAGEADLSAAADLSQDALRDVGRNAPERPAQHRERAALVEGRARKGRQAHRGAAPVAAHHVRSGNDPARSATATGSRIIRGIFPDGCRARLRPRCWIICRTTR